MGSVLAPLTALLSDSERCSELAESFTARLHSHLNEASRLGDAARAVELLAADLRAAADRLSSTQTQRATAAADRT